MPFMALMAAPLSAMLSVTGGDGSLDYPSHTRARTADNLFWRHHVSPTVRSRHQVPAAAGRNEVTWPNRIVTAAAGVAQVRARTHPRPDGGRPQAC